MDILVSHDWLAAHLDDPDLVVIDCTNGAAWDESSGKFKTVSGRARWAEAHIRGSVHADFTEPGFAGNADKYRNTLPDPRAFADAMERLGVGDTSCVVLYDDAASLWATRLWWMLRWIGFDRAAVLNGGWPTWSAEVGDNGAGEGHAPARGRLSMRLRPELFVEIDAVLSALHDGGTLIIDGLSAAQHAGKAAELGLSGHIPGAVNIPGAELVDQATMRFLSDDALAARFPVQKARRCILYCGSGIAAASVAFNMHRMGHESLTIYMPGLQEWVEHPEAPIVTGI
ncbi:sulfurtransferase [Marimonas lutisalis]|uniref:sulfurtransferase n=1 Tax=Marimonas lutisalis TaxID=2545756 RepID=UPI001376078C|nr:rhodanese-like domain-containing protein [Marimonas lutisalis]